MVIKVHLKKEIREKGKGYGDDEEGKDVFERVNKGRGKSYDKYDEGQEHYETDGNG